MKVEDKMKLPRADGDDFKATYENYEVACPICGERNVLNRITDIKSIGAACGKPVQCLHCGGDFLIIGDNVDEIYEYLLNDCKDLIKQKRYRFCLLNLCQACEAFFMKCIDIKLLWEPYRRGVFGTDNRKYKIFDDFAEKTHKKFKKFTYLKLLNVFFDLYLYNKAFLSQDEISDYVENLRKFPKSELSDNEIRIKSTGIQCELFLELKELKINEIRNDTAHKDGFRPTLANAQEYLKKVRRIIEKMEEALNLTDMLFYCKNSNMMAMLGK